MRRAPPPRRARLDSPRNARVQAAHRLESDSAARRREGLYVAWGVRIAEEAIAAAAPVATVLLAESAGTPDTARMARALEERGAEVVETTPRVLEAIAAGAGDQGILLVVRRREARVEDLLGAETPLLLAAHGVQDPGNLGTMARTALAFGATGLLALEGCADPFAGRTVRAAMGALFRLPVARPRLADLPPLLERAGARLVAADLSGDRRPDEADLRGAVVVCVGSEGRGLPEAATAAATARVRVPTTDGMASLNVQAAAAVLLYEARRQRGFAGLG